ncbi:MAG: MBL fold metallo-hydrolase [Lachnospiraceae bacterium]|nr:MBL fold metallo-hydrolase [Lachnospiraceae bacterium]
MKKRRTGIAIGAVVIGAAAFTIAALCLGWFRSADNSDPSGTGGNRSEVTSTPAADPTAAATPAGNDSGNSVGTGKFKNENDYIVMTGSISPASERRIPKETLRCETPDFTKAKEGGLTVTWFGHSASLVQLGTVNILIDPVFGDRTSPVSFAGPKRFAERPVTAESLPDIDVLILSHDHYDHTEESTIRATADKVKHYVVPLGVDELLAGWGIPRERITALDWWDETTIDGVTYALTPSQHNSGRGPVGMDTLWGGVYFRDGAHSVYYTGDGGYYDVFTRVYGRYGAPDLMLVECGQYDPGWAMTHMFPEQSAQAAADVHAKWVIPVHWGAYSLCNTAWDDSIIRMSAAAETKGLNLATPRIGQTVEYDEIANYREKWWEAYD